MTLRNVEIADIFEEVADLLEIQQANPFRIRAYRNAARLLRGRTREMAEMVAAGEDPAVLPGIGEDLAGKIRELVESGHLAMLDRLRGELPQGLVALLKLPGLGPKRVQALHHELGVNSLDDLRRLIEKNRLPGLAGFGPKTVMSLREALSTPAMPRRFLLPEVEPYVDEVERVLRGLAGVEKVEVAGSYRRRRDTVGDLDVLVAAAASGEVVKRFVGMERVVKVLAEGPTRASVVLRNGLQVDLRVVAPESFGAALYYFTGSKAHNIAVRRLAQEAGLKINEYGVWRGEKRIAGETEASVAKAVGLPLIPPELREDRGEIAAAAEGRLPGMVAVESLKGDLHCHTNATDGKDTLAEMAAAAKAAGLHYIAITDHSRRLTVAHGLDESRLARECEAIDRLNEKLSGIVVLKGIEVDILEDGSLDLPDRALARLDLVVGAIHSHFDLPIEKQTARVLKAMNQRYFSILAHPGGRLLGQREALKLDIERVVGAARQRGCYLELNAQPDRLDLDDSQVRMAKEAGVLVSVGSDAHRTTEFGFLRYGIDQARRGWLEAKDVLNTRPLREVRKLLRSTM